MYFIVQNLLIFLLLQTSVTAGSSYLIVPDPSGAPIEKSIGANLLIKDRESRADQALYDAKLLLLEKSVKDLKQELALIHSATDEEDSSFWDSTFLTWTGILLACVAIIVTALGVMIALLAIVGYRDVISKAEKKAADIAEIILLKQVNDGAFDKIINDNLEKIALRGTAFSPDLEEDDLGSQENT